MKISFTPKIHQIRETGKQELSPTAGKKWLINSAESVSRSEMEAVSNAISIQLDLKGLNINILIDKKDD